MKLRRLGTIAALCMATPSVLQALDLTIVPTGPQDAEISGGIGYMDRTNTILRWGYYDVGGPSYHAIVSVGMHTLPAVSPSEIAGATLRLSRTDVNYTGPGTQEHNFLTILAYHIDAADDTQATFADQTSAALDLIGTYRSPGVGSTDSTRFVEFDVTNMVKADLAAGRATFAWRVEPESLPAYAGGGHKQSYFPSIDNGDPGFGTNKSGRLILSSVPPEICDNGIDDDGDNLTDCADPDCVEFPGEPCRETHCADGLDNDNDTKTDCNDSDCSQSPSCPEICNDQIDNNADTLVDCGDPQCLNSPFCPEKSCADGLDNDGDGLVDCADPDCLGISPCGAEVCNDQQDNDNDCLVDGADPDCTRGTVIRPTGPQDGEISTAIGYLDATGGYLRWGYYDIGGPDYLPIVSVGMHTLAAIAPGSLGRATLRLARTDIDFTGGGTHFDLTILVNHIDAADDTKVTSADQGSPVLGPIGVYRVPSAGVASSSRFIEFDVTSLVLADVVAGRATFAWRVEPQSLPAYNGGGHKQAYFPSVDSTDAGFGDNKSGRIVLQSVGQYESSCTDGSDNDGDGYIDCADADCYRDPACTTQEICGDGMDNDGNGLVDCADTACTFSKCCSPPVEICTNGVDDEGDGLVDCADPDCRCAANCGPWPAEICLNGVDDDCDEATDCADSDCAKRPVCLSCHDPFADMDGDGDVDQEDFGKWQACFTGPSGTASQECICADWDGNGAIDAADFAVFELCASGPAIPANPACDN